AVAAGLEGAEGGGQDEGSVGLLSLPRACRGYGGKRREEAEEKLPGHTHGLFPQFWLPEPGRQPAPDDSHAERSARRHGCDRYCVIRLGSPHALDGRRVRSHCCSSYPAPKTPWWSNHRSV